MNVEIGTETAQFPEKEYINEIFLAVYSNWTEEVSRIKDYAVYMLTLWSAFYF